MNPLKNPKLPKIWAIIPAAGSGRRFSATELKQYQLIQGQTVLEHTVSRLNDVNLAGYVLAIGHADTVAKTLPFVCSEKSHFCWGGKERVDSVLNALNYLEQIADINDWVLVHDAARPCVSVACLEKLIDTAIKNQQSAILAIPVRDTLKRGGQQQTIQSTVSRENLWQAQTPQISQVGWLKSSIEKSLKDQITITDEASALEHVGHAVHLVQGRADNLKITYPDDLELARLILASQ